MNNLQQRLLDYSIQVYKVSRNITKDPALNSTRSQLIRAASSPGANYAEAQSASSRKDFHNKIRIALKETRESRFWLEYFKKISPKNDQLESLLIESEELCKILSAIAFKTKPT